MDRSESPSSMTYEETLEHFGVKGMHWGVRKRSGNTPSGVTVKEIPGKGIKTSGGHGASPSADAVRAAQAHQVAKTSGTHALSNRELQDLVTRMNLEQQYTTLVSKQPSKLAVGQKLAKDVLSTGRTINDVISFINSPAGKLVKAQLAAK